MKHILRNWKTSLIGTGALGTGLHQLIETGDIKAALPLLLAGLLGLIAKDGDKTGKAH